MKHLVRIAATTMALVFTLGCEKAKLAIEPQTSVQPSAQVFPAIPVLQPRVATRQTTTVSLAPHIVVNGFHNGMTWQEGEAVMSRTHGATCVSGGGHAREVLYSKSCRVHHQDDTTDYSFDTELMFYRDRLFLISSNYHYESVVENLKRTFGQPKQIGNLPPSWYHRGVLYELTDSGLEIIDSNYAPPTIRAQVQMEVR